MTKFKLVQYCSGLFFSLLMAYPGYAQHSEIKKFDNKIIQAIELSILHQYDKSEKIFNDIINDSPFHPAGYFYKAAMIQSKMMDFETAQWEPEFIRNIMLALHYADSLMNQNKSPAPELLFYKGSSLSYIAFYEGKKRKYIPAIRHGLAGISNLKKIGKNTAMSHDACFGIGSYKFWRSQITRHINWLPLIPDEREQGLQMVLSAIEDSKFSKYAAMNEIVWMLLEFDRAEEAYLMAAKALDKFPGSRFFLWGAAKSAFALQDYETASTFFITLLNSISSAKPNNFYNEYICRLKLARCYFNLNSFSEAKSYLNSLDDLNLSPGIKTRLKKQRKEAGKLKQHIFKRLKAIDNLAAKNDFTNKKRRHESSEIPN